MNIVAVTQTAQLYPVNQTVTQIPGDRSIQTSQQEGKARSVEAVDAQVAVSIQVQDMAHRVMEDAANQLLQSVAAQTGLGQNVDVLV